MNNQITKGHGKMLKSAIHGSTDVDIHLGLPVYNGEKFIRETLESILNQTFRNWVLFISDNNSTDNTLSICNEIASHDNRIIVVKQNYNIGALKNFEYTLNVSDCKYFKWVAADDLMDDSFLEKCISKLEQDAELMMCFTGMINIDTYGRKIRDYPELPKIIGESISETVVNFILHPEVLGKANLIYSVFRSDFCKEIWKIFVDSQAIEMDIWGSDMVFNLAALARGKAYVVPDILFKKRLCRDTDSISRVDYINIENPKNHIFPISNDFYHYRNALIKVTEDTPFKEVVASLMEKRKNEYIDSLNEQSCFLLAKQGNLNIVDLIRIAERFAASQGINYAIALYQLWLEHTRSPLSYAVYFNLGVLLESVGDYSKAEHAYRKSIAENAHFEQARSRLVQLLQQKQQTTGTIVIVKLMGGLGNQMFQFAAGLALARHQNARLKLDLSFLLEKTRHPDFTIRDYELGAFYLVPDCETVNLSREEQQNLKLKKENRFQFDTVFFESPTGVYLDGYWQSWKYFTSIEAELRQAFVLRNLLNIKYRELAIKIQQSVAVCVHVRRGDLVHNPSAKAIHGICDLAYYEMASAAIMREFPDAHFYIFSDDPEWCRSAQLLGAYPHTIVSDGSPVSEDFQLMRLCRHFIIANSSLSWWAAYLGEAPDKRVIAPEPWFDNPSLNTTDLLPPDWIKLPKFKSIKVSVIIPCYNQAHFLPESVASVVAQTVTDWEIIIINDGSPDNTSDVARELIEKYPHCNIRLIEKQNGGLADARNCGIKAARGEFILPLDADDKLHPQMLEKTLVLLENNSEISIVYGNYQEFGASSRITNYHDFNAENLILFNQLPYCSLYRKKVWEAVGGYKNNMVYGYEDWEFWISCVEHGYRFMRCQDLSPLFFYRVKETSMYTKALQYDDRLKAQIVLNHPNLYHPSMVLYAQSILMSSKESTTDVVELISEVEKLLAMNKIEHAVVRYRQWIWFHHITSPLAYIIYFNLGVLLQDTGDYAGAQQAYQQALAINPDFKEAHINLSTLPKI